VFQGAVPVPEGESMTNEGNSVTRFDEMRYRVLQEENARLRTELSGMSGQLEAVRAELNEQARLNGIGSEREAKLMGEIDRLQSWFEYESKRSAGLSQMVSALLVERDQLRAALDDKNAR
jgi:predicted nuclease with TOPRIM domain